MYGPSTRHFPYERYSKYTTTKNDMGAFMARQLRCAIMQEGIPIACIHVSTQSGARLAWLHPGTARCDMMKWLFRARACSTISVSRSSSAITSSPSVVARSGRRTTRVVRILLCAFREIVPEYACRKTCCIGALAVWHRLWRCMLMLSISEADRTCGRSRTACTGRAREMDRRLPRPKETVPPTRNAAGSS